MSSVMEAADIGADGGVVMSRGRPRLPCPAIPCVPWRGATPDLIRLPDGSYLVVKGAAGRDGLGMTTKVAVMRWTGTPPTVRGIP